MSFKQFCSPVAALTGPWNCVVYRDIRLLKAHLCNRHFSSNYVGDAAPKNSSGRGFMLTNFCHTSARGLICAMRSLVIHIKNKNQVYHISGNEQPGLRLRLSF